jgi:hypothetical protein
MRDIFLTPYKGGPAATSHCGRRSRWACAGAQPIPDNTIGTASTGKSSAAGRANASEFPGNGLMKQAQLLHMLVFSEGAVAFRSLRNLCFERARLQSIFSLGIQFGCPTLAAYLFLRPGWDSSTPSGKMLVVVPYAAWNQCGLYRLRKKACSQATSAKNTPQGLKPSIYFQ